MYMDHSKVKRQSHDSHTMIPTLVGLYNVFTCTGSSNETAFSSGDLMGGVAPGRSARGSISREAWTEVRERASVWGGTAGENKMSLPVTHLLQRAPVISGAISETPLFPLWHTPVQLCHTPCSTMPYLIPHPLFHYAIPYTTPLVPLCHSLHHTPCSTMCQWTVSHAPMTGAISRNAMYEMLYCKNQMIDYLGSGHLPEDLQTNIAWACSCVLNKASQYSHQIILWTLQYGSLTLWIAKPLIIFVTSKLRHYKHIYGCQLN